MSDDTAKNSAMSRKATRLASGICLLAGLATGYFLILRPLQEAQAGVPELSWGGSYGFVSPMLLLIGVGGLLFPGIAEFLESPRIVKSNGSLTGLGVVVMVAVAVPVIGLCFWIHSYIEHQFQLLGYVDGRK